MRRRLIAAAKGQQHKELRRFSTMTADLLTCVDWLKAARCQAITMALTGVYWKSPFNLMEGHFEHVMIVNAQHLKRVPGRKTDKKDAEWIAELLQLGSRRQLVFPSILPSDSASQAVVCILQGEKGWIWLAEWGLDDWFYFLIVFAFESSFCCTVGCVDWVYCGHE